ncbi:glycosyltransferase [Pseudoalteromonas sp. MIP2626]|uniref:glycosyltransferase n=1 Tax=Pseudoalteromonas sp. MIP2626 TaxID=2705464 RepID=UPI0015C7C28B|nr:glycosyltransferase [Pseudoalteromonas sp. MIP2626]NYR13103.1 glycosyltransferase [Pseudoalteromonas sp. MIP2626]
MKILLVITGLGMGGAEHVVVNLADNLVSRGNQVKIAYLTGEPVVLPSNPDVEVFSVGFNSSKDLFKAYFRLRAFVKKFRPDVVHSHMFHANLISRLLRLTLSFSRLISTAHNTNEGGKLRMLAYRLTDYLADISTNVTDEAVAAFIQKGAVKHDRMVSITNGIDVNKFHFDPEKSIEKRAELGVNNEKVILAVGRLNEQKDYGNLLNAVALLKQKRQDFKVFIVGDGPLKAELLELVANLDIESYIEFLGIQRDVPELMAACDTFVLSSAWEGFGLVVAEAMSCERVVVATDCGGVAEVVGSCGILVEPKNHKALAQAIGESLELNDSAKAKLGAEARQRINEKFSLDANVEAYCKLYAQTDFTKL